MSKKTLGYWLATALLTIAMGGGGVMDLLRAGEVVETLERLGYPDYLATILGVAKLLGILVVLSPGLLRLKEWAYAGFVIDLLGAFASHVYVDDGTEELVAPVIVLVITLASWALRPASRRLA